MADVNTVVIASDRQELINQVSQKLVLLRNFDKIKSCTIEEAQNMLEELNPNVMILHCDNNNPRVIGLIKKLRAQAEYRNLPILLINENCSRETVIEAFDSGISDILFMPIIDYELLIRVIWCLQKNELNLNIESRNAFLASLEIVEADTGVYTQKYCDEFLKNEIAHSQKHSQKACILLVAPDKKYLEDKDIKEFVTTVKSSIRLNDSVVLKDDRQFYIYLQKTKLNGAYSVFERINNNLGTEYGASAGVIEVQGQEFEEIKASLETALEKASENTNSLIVASEFYAKEEPATTAIDLKRPNKLPEEQEEIVLDSDLDFDIDVDIDIDERPSGGILGKKSQSTYDKNSIKLFNQAYVRKLKVVVNPVFKKYEKFLKTKLQYFDVNVYTCTKSMFCATLNEVCASITIEYDGVEHAMVQLIITENDQKKLYETEEIDFTILDYRRMSLMMNELINKFFTVIKRKGH